MKKLFFFFLVASFYSMPSFAQDFVEEDLIGKWELVEYSGDFVAETSIMSEPNASNLSREGGNVRCADTLSFYSEEKHAENFWRLGYAKYLTDKGTIRSISMHDYFIYSTIGGGLRLHIQYSKNGTPTNQTVRYIVLSITKNQMELMTYDKKGKATYRKQEASSVRGIMSDSPESNSYYNLKGEKLASKPKKGIYINNGKKINAHN